MFVCYFYCLLYCEVNIKKNIHTLRWKVVHFFMLYKFTTNFVYKLPKMSSDQAGKLPCSVCLAIRSEDSSLISNFFPLFEFLCFCNVRCFETSETTTDPDKISVDLFAGLETSSSETTFKFYANPANRIFNN